MNARQVRASQIVATGRITEGNGFYFVPSQFGQGFYRVTLDGLFPTCGCDDYELTAKPCKHIMAAQEWAAQKANGTLPPEPPPVKVPRKTYKQDWPNYNRAQNNEKDHFQDFLTDLCASIAERERDRKKGGRPSVPLRDAAFVSVFKVYCGFSARRFMCDVRSAHERGCIAAPVCHNSVLKALESEALTPVLMDLIGASCAPLRAIETDFAVDSSGFATNSYTRWFDVKYGAKELQNWVKAHIATGVQTNCIAAVEILDQRSHDSPVLPALIDTVAKQFTVREVSADKAYAAQSNFEAVAKHGGTLYAAFKNNTKARAGGLFEKMFHLFSLNREDYLRHYHKRSNVESTFSAVKRKFHEAVRSKTPVAQKNEVLCKFICQNVTCLIGAMYELGIAQPTWRKENDGERSIIKFPGVG